ncbi:hypothetical protein NP233_g8340 [Leucocoprinus birnbaumii]|uniref:Uncharacterized protein n=1 Tax=Leucocoprinus birnbaumii TaxID=56174 RepID=A0AAD5VMI7_9AGAR|nr:hypothetical protein NP233_g8340 [Leucocoprinus birnbaumii]
MKEEELRKLEELHELFEFLDDIIPEDDGELVDLEPKRRGRKRRSTSVASTATDDDTPSHESGRSRTKANKRRRISEDGDESEEEEQGTPQPTVKTRIMPKRAATGKIPTEPIVITDSEDEGHIATPKNKKAAPGKSRQVKSEEDEAALDNDISQLLEPPSLGPPTPSTLSSLEDDSILGPADSEEDSDEEDEVNGLLVDE